MSSERRQQRRIDRMLREMDRREARGSRPPSDGLGRRARVVLASVAVLILVVAAAPTVWERSTGGSTARPDDAGTEPLGTPPTGTTEGPHEFIALVDGEPARYDPCTVIRIVVNSRTAVPGADQMLDEALTSVEAATGLKFDVEGSTDEEPDVDDARARDQAVLVAWSDPDEIDALDGDVAGVAGSSRMPGSPWFDSGTVVLDGPQLEELLRFPNGYADVRATVLHELGHLVGLDHVEASGELMQPEGESGLDDWGPGDREGLAALGGTDCRF